jgi:phosphoglycerol transferase MdoB-like AlkP superfamily enzyme
MTLSAGCSRTPGPPYPLACAVDAASPRLLETSRETSVPVTLTNTGLRAWNSASVHLSYHWLWVVPRETVSRSRWNLPYHNGIRTQLASAGAPGRAVAPGTTVNLNGRIESPVWPGLYWLQWDMVEEGITWFAQVSPRQPRTLVLVLPPAAWMLAPAPLLVAIWGLVALGTGRASRSVAARPASLATIDRSRAGDVRGCADVIWCVATLTFKPLVVVHEALLEPTAAAYWLTLGAALVGPFVALLVLPRRARVWTLVSLGILGSLIVLSDVVYYRFFGDVLSAPALLAAPQTGRVWESIHSLFSPVLLWLVIDWPVAIWLAARLSGRPGSDAPRSSRTVAAAAGLAIVVPMGLALSARTVLASTSLDQMFRNRAVVEQLGVFGYHLYDGWNYARSTWLRRPPTDNEVRDALSWFRERAPLRAGASSPFFGVARGLNLIVIQVESLQDFVVDYRVAGQEVMPHLRRWLRDSVRFTQVTDQTSEGRTSDAEFTMLTSLQPLDHGAVVFRFPGNHYSALPGLLVEAGYTTLSAVPFEPGFWNRRVVHPRYGFEQSLFESDFALTEQIGWGLNDRDFLQQMLPRLERLRRPFAAWLITLSLHHPFEGFPGRHKIMKLGALEGTAFGNYLHTMRFFDRALEDFRTGLARDGLLDSSVVAVFGDHDAGFARDAQLSESIGISNDEAAWAWNDRIPLFVRVPDRTGRLGLTGARDVPAGQTDFAPTLLSLLGVDAAPLPYVGRNLLGAPGRGPVTRPYGGWIDATHLFLTGGSSPECWAVSGRSAVGDCRGSDGQAARERGVSRLVVTSDLQERLRAMMAGAR